MTRCTECNAAHEAGESCRECFEALLAFENERPAVFGTVHHLTVACYFLQHPSGYATAALDMWRELIDDSLAGRATPRELLRRAGQRFAGERRVRDPSAARPKWWPRDWPMTVQHVFSPVRNPLSDEEYVRRAREWSRATSDTLATHRDKH